MADLLKRYEAVAFSFLILLSLGLHLFRIASPASPVFDEAYFTTYPADNVLGKIFFDVHPPLGKWLSALPLFFYPQIDLTGADYITFGHNATTDSLQTNYNPAPFGNFPYVPLRLISVLFGLLLVAGFYFLLRTLAGPIAAIAGTFLLVFENSLLLNTRLVLMDGMYLAFGVWSLYFFFSASGEKKRPRPLVAGLLFGLALSVKLTAVVFVGPALCALAIGFRNITGRAVIKYLLVACIVLLVAELGLSQILWNPRGILTYINSTFGGPFLQKLSGDVQQLSWISAAVRAAVVNGLLTITGYVSGFNHPLESPWYIWPFMWKPIQYTKQITLVGNPFVWLSSTAAFLGALWLIIRKGVKRVLNAADHPTLLLTVGYVFCLVPFFTIVHRSTFLYHYFPALLFAIALAGVFVGRLIEKDDLTSKLSIAAIAILTIVGFLIVAPYTYGV